MTAHVKKQSPPRTRKPPRGGKPYMAREGMTLEECGKVMNLTRERIRQIEQSALKKLRQYCWSHGIDPEDLRD